MNNQYYSGKFNSKNTLIYLGGLMLAAVLMVFFIQNFNENIRSKRALEEYNKMSEIADIYASGIEERLNVLTSFVSAAASQISAIGVTKSRLTAELINNMVNNNDIMAMAVIFADRSYISTDPIGIAGTAVSKKLYPHTTIIHNDIGGKEYITIFAPIYKDGVLKANLRAIVLSNKAEDIIGQKIFRGEGYSALIASDGRYILKSRSIKSLAKKEEYSFFDLLHRANIIGSLKEEDIKKAFSEGRDSSFAFEIDGNIRMAFLRNISAENGYVCIFVPLEYIAESTQSLRQGAIFLTVNISLIFLILIIYILFKERSSQRELASVYNMTNSLINNIPGGFVMCDYSERFTFKFISTGFAELAGCPFDETLSIYMGSFWNSVHPADREKIREKIHRQLKNSNKFDVIYRMVRKNGTLIYALNKGGLVTDNDGSSVLYGTIIDVTNREKTAEALKISEERYKLAISQSDVYVFEYDAPNDILINSDRISAKFGTENILRSFSKQNIKASDNFVSMLSLLSPEQPTVSRESSYETKTGQRIYLKIHLTGLYNKERTLTRVIGVMDDITDKKIVEVNYLRARKFRDTLIKLYDDHFEFDITHDKIIADSINPDREGKSFKDERQIFIRDILHPDDIGAVAVFADENSLKEKLTSGISDFDVKYRIRETKDSSYRWKGAHVTVFTSPADGSLRIMLFAKDIHDSVEEENALTDRALRDTLTGLYNKSATELLISQKLESDSRKDPAPLNALLLLDLDNFKAANDLMGHIFGDALLTEVSKKLTNVFRSSDILGRIGGDEFMVLMKDLPNEAVAIRKAHEARGAIIKMHHGGIADLNISASIGLSFSHGCGTTFEELYRKADIALYKSKDSGKNFVSSYDISMGNSLDREAPVHEISHKENIAFFSENQLRYIFSLMYTSANTRTAIKGSMELLINHFNLSRAYVFETSHDGSCYKELFEVCGENITPNIEFLKNGTKPENRPNYPANFNEAGFFIAKTDELEEPLKSEMGRQDIILLIQVAIIGNGSFRGFIGFDICDSKVQLSEKDITTLANAGKMLAWFTLREFDKEAAEQTRTYAKQALCEIDVPIFVVNPENMELLFENDAAKNSLGRLPIGAQCYAAIFKKSTPCKNCPIMAANNKDTATPGLIYVPIIWDLDTAAKAVNCLSLNSMRKE